MDLDALNKVAKAMVAPGKGILAADEVRAAPSRSASTPSASNAPRTTGATIANCCFARPRRWNHVSGVILYDETIRQNAKDGTPLVKMIEKAGSIPGHQGRRRHQAPARLPERAHHHGLDRLARPAAEVLRARRPLRQVAGGDRHRRRHPDAHLRHANAHALARYAALCQERRSFRSSSRKC